MEAKHKGCTLKSPEFNADLSMIYGHFGSWCLQAGEVGE